MEVKDFDYELPEELIAQRPVKERASCRLMLLDRGRDRIEHRTFNEIKEFLKAGDVLVLNNSKVIPARLFGQKAGTGANIEFLLIKRIEGDIWETMVRPGRRLKSGDRVVFSEEEGKGLSAEIRAFGTDGTRLVEFTYDGMFMERLYDLGTMPLPPYIERAATAKDRDDYQTVYADPEGSVAAPTAGLHFTEELLDEIREYGVETVFLTLHVGIGTFRPVKVDRVEDHHMHMEEYEVSQEAADKINRAIREGGRIISVGTTSLRTLESCAYKDEGDRFLIRPGKGETDIFIYPGYEYKIVDGLITNFHLPKSTLMMLVSALAGRERILKAYEEAIEEKYRFFSYGDAMFII